MFSQFKIAVQRQFNAMKTQPVYRVIIGKDRLWETYLNSFPAGSNPIFRECTEHDCQCCKSFIRTAGAMVTIKDGQLVSLWDVTVPEPYQTVADALSALVKSCQIENVYLHEEPTIGTDKNYQQTDAGVLTWEHFYLQLPPALHAKKTDIRAKLGDIRTTKEMMLRALTEITDDAVEIVLDLISQNSLYRGAEKKGMVEGFKLLKAQFILANNKDLFCWVNTTSTSVARIRNDVIGTLLVDLSEGKPLEQAVAAYEAKVAPTNYQRPTALITKAMVEKAKVTLSELGLTSALDRRFAVIEDISVADTLFADRSARKQMSGNVLDEICEALPTNTKTLGKVEEISIEQFIKNILPTATSLEIMLENRHTSNLVSLVAPSDLTAKHLFKWDNPFSWSYAGDMADSIKERVKKAGGNVSGELCCRLAWYNRDDLDFHMIEPDGHRIYFQNRGKQSRCGGMLDVDANGLDGIRTDPCENIFYEKLSKMKEGVYTLLVNQYTVRDSSDVGFDAEIDVMGEIKTFSYAKALRDRENVIIAEIHYSKAVGVKIVPKLEASQAVRTIWGLPTHSFHRVNILTLSPNYWGSRPVGNKHYFFMLDGCINEGQARGFFNEFLTPELTQHRKVLEVVGTRMKTENSDNQLSGLGFSSTQRNSILCRVTGTFTRIIKIVF